MKRLIVAAMLMAGCSKAAGGESPEEKARWARAQAAIDARPKLTPEQKQAAIDAKKAAADAKVADAAYAQRALREKAASDTEHIMLRGGMEVDTVVADGTDLRIEYFRCGRSFLAQLEDIVGPLKRIGFERVVCRDGDHKDFILRL